MKYTPVVLLALAVVIAGCGRKSDLDTPYQADLDRRNEAERAKEDPLPPVPEKPVEDRRFILDALID